MCLPPRLLQRIAQKELGRLQKERSKDQSKIKQLETESKQREIVMKVCWEMGCFVVTFFKQMIYKRGYVFFMYSLPSENEVVRICTLYPYTHMYIGTAGMLYSFSIYVYRNGAAHEFTPCPRSVRLVMIWFFLLLPSC